MKTFRNAIVIGLVMLATTSTWGQEPKESLPSVSKIIQLGINDTDTFYYIFEPRPGYILQRFGMNEDELDVFLVEWSDRVQSQVYCILPGNKQPYPRSFPNHKYYHLYFGKDIQGIEIYYHLWVDEQFQEKYPNFAQKLTEWKNIMDHSGGRLVRVKR